tara:strand:+ start:734 stop:964 length:231 start_codon:yes stop_codon:yes gene_type:complete
VTSDKWAVAFLHHTLLLSLATYTARIMKMGFVAGESEIECSTLKNQVVVTSGINTYYSWKIIGDWVCQTQNPTTLL